MISNEYINGLFLRATQLHQQEEFFKARLIYKNLLCILPGTPAFLGLMGTALTQEGKHYDALNFLKRCLSLDPFHEATFSNLGNALRDLGEIELAILNYRKAIVLNPRFPDAFRNLAIAYGQSDSGETGLRTMEIAVNLAPHDPKILNAYGDAYSKLDQHEEGLEQFTLAIQLNPGYAEAHRNLAVTLERLQRYEESIQSCTRALALKPELVEAYLSYGVALAEMHQENEALTLINRALLLSPNNTGALMNQGRSLGILGQFRLASEPYLKAFHIDNSLTECLGRIVYSAAKIWDWNSIDTYWNQIIESIALQKSIGTPFPLLTISDDPALHKAAASNHAKKMKWEGTSLKVKPTLQPDRPIHVGYFSSDLRDHPVYKNLKPLIETHDRQRFRIFAFSFSNNIDSTAYEVFDEVFDVSSLPNEEVVELAKEKNIDIAVDLNGHTTGARTQLFSNGLAPFQVNYLGYPGTMGGSGHTHIIADGYVIPEGHEEYYSERVIRLPHFFMPYDLRSNQSQNLPYVSREQYGLPENAFVFCSFNDFHKITQGVFQSWNRILRACPNSVLWIALRGDLSENQVFELFERNGVPRSRIIVAGRVKDSFEHIARLRLANLMLDTFPYNSHTTACDAISMGLPLLTISGKSFASRVSGSLLMDIGACDLVTHNFEDYEEMAITLANDPVPFKEICQKVDAGVERTPYPGSFTLSIEKAYCEMIETQS